MDDAGGPPAVVPPRGWSRRATRFGARGQMGLRDQGSRIRPEPAGRGLTPSPDRGGQRSLGLLVVEFHQFRLELGVREDGLGGAPPAPTWLGAQGLVSDRRVVKVEHVEKRLVGQRCRFPDLRGVDPASNRVLPESSTSPGSLGGRQDQLPVLLDACDSFSSRGWPSRGVCQIGQDQLGVVDRLDVAGRIDAPVDVNDIVVVEGRTWQMASASRNVG